MSLKSYLGYLNDLGLRQVTDYDYLDKKLNVSLEIERFLNRSVMMFQWHDLPDTIPQRQLELMLQAQGYAIIGQIEGNLYACYGGLGGVLDEYFRPTRAIVSIPYLRFNADWEIGKDCIVIKNDLLRQGMLPLYSKYLTLQNETEVTLLLSLVNQRVQSHISASDTNTIESARQYLKDLMDGKQGIIADNAFLESLKIVSDKNVGNNLEDIVEVLHYLRGQLYNEIGLATNYNLKKERITQAEVELNTDNLYPLIDGMMFCRREGLEEVYNLFGADWGVEFNSSWDYRIMNGEPIVTEGSEDGADNSIDSDNGVLDSFGADDGTDDKGNESGVAEVTDKIQDVFDVVTYVSDGDNADSGDSVDSVLSDFSDDVTDVSDGGNADGVADVEIQDMDVSDNIEMEDDKDTIDSVTDKVEKDVKTLPDDRLTLITDEVATLANELAVNEGYDGEFKGLSNNEVLETEGTVVALVEDIADNIVDGEKEGNEDDKNK